MRIVVALGANGLLKRGEPASAQAQQDNIRLAAVQLAKVAEGNSLVIVHGSGPQVELELGNLLPSGRSCATLLTMVEDQSCRSRFQVS
jgi:carbamate kinase